MSLPLLLDADVMIDIERRHPPALAWIASHPASNAALPGIVTLELLYGARSPKDASRIHDFTSRFRTYWPTVADSQRAVEAQAHARRTHGVGVLDLLIAQTAIGLDATLATFNTRHFRGIHALKLIQPYER